MLKKNKRLINASEAIHEALKMSMKKNKNVVLIGLGVDDPKGVFGTTKNLHKIFKKNKRVFDFPTAENAMTGIALGASISGIVPVISIKELNFLFISGTDF